MAVSRMTLGGLASGMDTDSMIEKLMAAQRYRVDRYKKRNISKDYRREEWKKMNSKIYSFFNKDLTAMRLKGNLIKNKVSSSSTAVADVEADANAPKGTHELEVVQLAKTAATASGRLTKPDGTPMTESTTFGEMGFTGAPLRITYKDEHGVEQTIDITAEADDTLKSFAEKIKRETKGKIDLEANADIKNGRLFLSTKKTGEKQNFRIGGALAPVFGFTTDEVKGQDAKYRYNGMDFTNDSNNVEVNGLKATLKSVGQTTVSVTKDTDAAYKQIIDFFKKYNALVNEMQDKVNVSVPRSQRDMEPLVDTEKKGMSEADIKKWEETLRGRVFKGDKDLKGILSDFRTSFAMTTVEGNGKYNALSSLGILTGDYKQGSGALMFVDGDSELGGKRSDMPNKLKAALEEDPEAVSELISTVAKNLSDKLSERMKSTTLRSYMSFYDDKALQEDYRQMERKIQTLEDKLIDIEEKYRKQFAAMEKALAKSNSTSNWLSQQLGGGR